MQGSLGAQLRLCARFRGRKFKAQLCSVKRPGMDGNLPTSKCRYFRSVRLVQSIRFEIPEVTCMESRLY